MVYSNQVYLTYNSFHASTSIFLAERLDFGMLMYYLCKRNH
ncbi:MAG: hypothetical protein H6Q13_449 [Bacteroidetes bacterium]|nr:hypothetical protein [Bacteroidota bacterium]